MKNTCWWILSGVVVLVGVVFLNNFEISFRERINKPITIPVQILGKCGIEGCHGMDVNCGPKVAEMCDEMYVIGDGCRQYVKCAKVQGVCQIVENLKFEACKSCVKECISKTAGNDIALSQCESTCMESGEDWR